MTDMDIKTLLFGGGSGIVGIAFGLYCFISRKQGKEIPQITYYNAINLFIWGIMMAILMVIFFIVRVTEFGRGYFSENAAYCLIIIWVVISSLVCGVHGILKREKLSDQASFRLSVGQVVGALIAFVGIVLFLLKWGWPVK